MSKLLSKFLEDRIIQASEKYYLSEPIMTDEQFDQLVEELRVENPSSPVLRQVGWGMKIYKDKVPLPVKIQHSLPKIQIESVESPPKGLHWKISPKVDGMSCVLHYQNGVLKQAVTRGDGEFGIDITPKMNRIKVPRTISRVYDVFVRGELYINVDVFNLKLSEDYANPRNAVAGIINSKSFDSLEYVDFGAHPQGQIVNLPESDKILLNMLPTWDGVHIQDLRACRAKSIDMGFPIDGMVIQGHTDYGLGKTEESAVAIKFETEAAVTSVISVDWEKRREER